MATCTATDDCPKPAFHRGWCSMHYERWKTHGDFTTVRKPGNPRSLGNCPVDDGKGPCGRPAIAKDLCTKHYQRFKKFGDPLITKLDRDATPEERFWSWVDKDGPIPECKPELGPCWVYTGGLAEGYGAFSLDGRQVKAHRVAYLWLVGDIPDDCELDHLCRNRACVRPDHLEAVTHWTNVARGISPHGQNAAKTRCRNGHEFSPENTRVNSKGQRVCITCARAACMAWYYRQKAAREAA